MVRGMTDIILAPECNDSDRTWVSLMLQAAEIPAKVFKACGCGYGEECGMHCHHGTMLKDPCPGDDFWKTNGIKPTLVQRLENAPDTSGWVQTWPSMQPKPKILYSDYERRIHHLEHLGPISFVVYDDMNNHGELHVLVEQQKQAQARKDADLAIEEAQRWLDRSKEVIEVFEAGSSKPIARWTANSGPM